FLVSQLIPVSCLVLILWIVAVPKVAHSSSPTTFNNATFDFKRTFGTGADLSSSIAVAYMNGDGYLDLVVGNKFSPLNYTAQQSAVYLNDGQGNFYSGAFTCGVTQNVRCFGTVTEDSSDVVVGDMNGDGSLDIIVANDYGTSYAAGSY